MTSRANAEVRHKRCFQIHLAKSPPAFVTCAEVYCSAGGVPRLPAPSDGLRRSGDARLPASGEWPRGLPAVLTRGGPSGGRGWRGAAAQPAAAVHGGTESVPTVLLGLKAFESKLWS